MFRNVGDYLHSYTSQHPRRLVIFILQSFLLLLSSCIWRRETSGFLIRWDVQGLSNVRAARQSALWWWWLRSALWITARCGQCELAAVVWDDMCNIDMYVGKVGGLVAQRRTWRIRRHRITYFHSKSAVLDFRKIALFDCREWFVSTGFIVIPVEGVIKWIHPSSRLLRVVGWVKTDVS